MVMREPDYFITETGVPSIVVKRMEERRRGQNLKLEKDSENMKRLQGHAVPRQITTKTNKNFQNERLKYFTKRYDESSGVETEMRLIYLFSVKPILRSLEVMILQFLDTILSKGKQNRT